MRAIAILVIVAVLGFFGYQFAANGRGPAEAVGVLTGATAQAEAEAAAAAAAELEAAAAAEAEAAAASAEAAATEAAEAAAAEATEAAEDAVEEVVEEAMAETSVADLLTTDGFDADKVMELVDGSDLSVIQKTTITTALDAAKENPELLEAALDQLKGMLGM